MNKQAQQLMFSSKTDDWATPTEFFEKLNWRFGPFDLDACASIHNTKCANFFTEAEDGLSKDWEGFTTFVNPPYGRGIDKWIKKAFDESRKDETRVVMLIPARTDTKYWHQYVMRADEIYFLKGRLKFGECDNSAPFPSAVVVFDGTNQRQIFGAMNR
jgi:site-specific DNA-methyltransferase (adenine-specific)